MKWLVCILFVHISIWNNNFICRSLGGNVLECSCTMVSTLDSVAGKISSAVCDQPASAYNSQFHDSEANNYYLDANSTAFLCSMCIVYFIEQSLLYICLSFLLLNFGLILSTHTKNEMNYFKVSPFCQNLM